MCLNWKFDSHGNGNSTEMMIQPKPKNKSSYSGQSPTSVGTTSFAGSQSPILILSSFDNAIQRLTVRWRLWNSVVHCWLHCNKRVGHGNRIVLHCNKRMASLPLKLSSSFHPTPVMRGFFFLQRDKERERERNTWGMVTCEITIKDKYLMWIKKRREGVFQV